MATVSEIYDYIDGFAPFDTQLGFDNAGFLVGDGKKQVKKAMVCLDVTRDVIKQASDHGCQLIISHHPVIFDPLRRVYADSVVYSAIQNELSIISAHTNLDIAEGGVNTCLAGKIGLIGAKMPEGADMGLIGDLPEPMTPEQFALHVRDSLGCGAVSYTEGHGEIRRAAVLGGAGGEEAELFFSLGADAFVTGESKHHLLIAAAEAKKTLVVAGHYETEVVVVRPLARMLSERFTETEFITAETIPPVKYI